MNTLKELAERLATPESTLRLYRDEFDELIPTQGSGRRRRYDERGAEVLRRIIRWKREGRTAAQIRDELAKEQRPQTVGRQRNVEERLDEFSARLEAQRGEIALLRVEVSALRTDFRSLLEILRQDPPPTFEEAVIGQS